MKKPFPVSPAKSSGVVLLVEDEALIRTMTRIMLERLGHEVMIACDGIEAVEHFTANIDRIKCVLLDLTMPRMGEWKPCRHCGRFGLICRSF